MSKDRRAKEAAGPPPPVPPIPEAYKRTATSSTLSKFARRMASRAHIRVSSGEKKGVQGDSDRLRPPSLLRSSTPERLQPHVGVSPLTWAVDRATYVRNSSLSGHSGNSAGQPSAVDSPNSDHNASLASPRLSPLEFSRMYLLERARAAKENRPCELPPPTKRWYWTPGYEEFLIIPVLPPYINRDDPLHPLYQEQDPNARSPSTLAQGASKSPEENLESSGRRKADDVETANKAPIDPTCPRLSLNLGEMESLSSSFAEFESMGAKDGQGANSAPQTPPANNDSSLCSPKSAETAVARERDPVAPSSLPLNLPPSAPGQRLTKWQAAAASSTAGLRHPAHEGADYSPAPFPSSLAGSSMEHLPAESEPQSSPDPSSLTKHMFDKPGASLHGYGSKRPVLVSGSGSRQSHHSEIVLSDADDSLSARSLISEYKPPPLRLGLRKSQISFFREEDNDKRQSRFAEDFGERHGSPAGGEQDSRESGADADEEKANRSGSPALGTPEHNLDYRKVRIPPGAFDIAPSGPSGLTPRHSKSPPPMSPGGLIEKFSQPLPPLPLRNPARVRNASAHSPAPPHQHLEPQRSLRSVRKRPHVEKAALPATWLTSSAPTDPAESQAEERRTSGEGAGDSAGASKPSGGSSKRPVSEVDSRRSTFSLEKAKGIQRTILGPGESSGSSSKRASVAESSFGPGNGGSSSPSKDKGKGKAVAADDIRRRSSPAFHPYTGKYARMFAESSRRPAAQEGEGSGGRSPSPWQSMLERTKSKLGGGADRGKGKGKGKEKAEEGNGESSHYSQ